jgi:homoserine O-acetyltransferase
MPRLLLFMMLLLATPALAQAPAPREGSLVLRDFRFHTGEVLPELRLHYTTLGDPRSPAVLVLHGTTGTGAGMLGAAFGGQLFGPGQPLDATRYFIILPDSIGTGKSTKPSDGLRGAFPRYNYADMVRAQHAVVTEGLGIRHLRLVIGNSMGGMHTWLWASMYPGMMDAAVPMAAQPTPMAARNAMLRRLLVETIRQDPGYAGGNYTQPPQILRFANSFYATATNGGTLALQAAAPSAAQAAALVDQRLAAPQIDANDFVYQWDSSRDYDPTEGLPRIRARVLAINSADDERNPPETGVTEAALARIPGARLHLIPASAQTLGHGTTGNARFWAETLRQFLAAVP